MLRAELELSRLDDRLTQVKAREENARARLSRWLGQAAWQELQNNLPGLPQSPDRAAIEARLEQHPEISYQSAIAASHGERSEGW